MKIFLQIILLVSLQSALYASTPVTQENVTKLYVATFNRAPDSDGLNYWVNNAGLSLENVAKSFFDQPETQAKYKPGLANTEFVAAVYQNLFNRTADSDGLNYWVNELDSGNVEKSVFILAVINGAQDTSTFGKDKTILTNKTTVGLAFSDAGLDDKTDATNILSGVTDDTQTVTDAINTYINTTPSVQTIIDVLVFYDADVKNLYSDVSSRISHLFSVSNNIYKDSKLDVNINIKNILFYDAQTSPALNEIANDPTVQSLREQNNADIVLLYQENKENGVGLCGIAYKASAYDEDYQFKDGMYANVYINCPTDTTAHEIGHNMGLSHSHLQDGNAVIPFNYGLGYGVDSKFVTIMAYDFEFNTYNSINKFSSPNYECMPGYPCGIAVGLSGEAHATKVIKVTAPKISNLY